MAATELFFAGITFIISALEGVTALLKREEPGPTERQCPDRGQRSVTTILPNM